MPFAKPPATWARLVDHIRNYRRLCNRVSRAGFASLTLRRPPIKAASVGHWDPLLIRDLSTDLGGFAVSTEPSRTTGHYGYAVFFAGRTIEFTSHDGAGGNVGTGKASSEKPPATLDERVHSALADLYTRLTGSSRRLRNRRGRAPTKTLTPPRPIK